MIYNTGNNVAIDIYDLATKALNIYHVNFNQNQLFCFRITNKHEDTILGTFESKIFPNWYLSVKENSLYLSNNKESSISFI